MFSQQWMMKLSKILTSLLKMSETCCSSGDTCHVIHLPQGIHGGPADLNRKELWTNSVCSDLPDL